MILVVNFFKINPMFYIAEVNDVFCLFDNRGDNKIAASQLGDCLRALNQNPNESEIKKCGYTGNPGKYTVIFWRGVCQIINPFPHIDASAADGFFKT